MAGDTQSRQESLMKIVGGRLMAAPFLFCPDLWRPHPRKTREPADLVWACNNVVVLMYLQQHQMHDNGEKNKKKYQDGIDHNLRQAGGALKAWKRHLISGKNEWHRFSLPWKTT